MEQDARRLQTRRFAGYPAGAERTAVPNVFFTELLARLASRPLDLAVALYVFFAIGRKRGSPRFATLAELAGDEALRQAVRSALGLGAWDDEAIERELRASLDGLEREGLLLSADIDQGGDVAYFLPTPADRRSMTRLRPSNPRSQQRASAPSPSTRKLDDRPDIIAWYESAIGTVPPFLVEELREAEASYPAEWVEEAFREAAVLNHRSWRYVRRILERWAEEGRSKHEEAERDPATALRDRYYGGRWRKLLD